MTQNQPDWNLMAEKFDLWLPHIKPVGDRLIDALGAHPGHRILDLACGTGEPALTLARRFRGSADITGVDAAEGMIRAAVRKAETEGLSGLRFSTMPAEKLTFPDAAFDRVICRFGLMLFEDPLKGAAEMWRVLKPGGRFALAVWGEADDMTSLRITAEVLRPRLSSELQPPLERITSLGAPGKLEALLEVAGFSDFGISRHQLNYTFKNFNAYWTLVENSAIMARQLAALAPSEHAVVRDELASLASAYHMDGQLVLPHVYLVAEGRR